eukprot:g31044.t1
MRLGDGSLDRRPRGMREVTSDAEAKAAWKLLAAEAHLASGEAEFAVQRASEALVIFKKLSLKEAEAIPGINVHFFTKRRQRFVSSVKFVIQTIDTALEAFSDPGAAAEVAQGAAGSCRDAGDTLGEATMLLHQAKALLASMQDWMGKDLRRQGQAVCCSFLDVLWSKLDSDSKIRSIRCGSNPRREDPYAAAEAAIASCLLYREAGNSGGEAEALEVAARAHLLYDPEQAFKAAKEALAVCSGGGALTALAQIEKTWAAAKAQLHTAQRAEQAKSISCRGQSASTYKWPKVPQIRGPPAVDVFAQQMVAPALSSSVPQPPIPALRGANRSLEGENQSS